MFGTHLDFEYSSCVASEWKDGALKVMPDLLGEEPSGAGFEPLQSLGLMARPEDPEDGKGAGCLHAFQADEGFAMPTVDPRAIGRVPQGPKGSTTLYATAKDQTSYVHLDGSGYQQLLIKYGDKSLSITLDTTTDGAEHISIRHGEGHGVVLTGSKQILLTSANGKNYLELSDSGTVIQGPLKVIGAITGGDAAGVPVALSTELTNVLVALNAALVAGLDVSGPKAILAAPVVVSTPGSSKVSAAV
jgi:hypothetical protein